MQSPGDTLGWLRQASDLDLHDSVALLGTFMLSASARAAHDTAAGITPNRSPEVFVRYGDALAGMGEHRRAIAQYREALRARKPATRSANPPSQRQPCDTEPEIKLRIARSHVALKEHKAAMTVLETLPARSRTLQITLLLAKVYRSSGIDRAAASCYKEALRQCPFAVEAVVALAQLGERPQDLVALQPALATAPWLMLYAQAHAHAAAYDLHQAWEAFSSLESGFGHCLPVLLGVASVNLALVKSDAACVYFQRARQVDPYCVDHMDGFARCLASRGHTHELNKLCRELVAANRHRPEPWAAVGQYWAAKEERARAIEYCDRALTMDERHEEALHLKGSMLLSMGRAEQAIVAFRKANTMKPGLESFIGLAYAYLSVDKPREALATAKEAVALMPGIARTHTLVGRIHFTQGSSAASLEKARKVCAPRGWAGQGRRRRLGTPRSHPRHPTARLSTRPSPSTQSALKRSWPSWTWTQRSKTTPMPSPSSSPCSAERTRRCEHATLPRCRRGGAERARHGAGRSPRMAACPGRSVGGAGGA